MFILQESEFCLLAKPIDIWRTLPPQLLDLTVSSGFRDHGESKHMKNSWFSGASFSTGAGIEPKTFMVRVRRATAEPPWLSVEQYNELRGVRMRTKIILLKRELRKNLGAT